MPIGARSDPWVDAVTRVNLLGPDLLAARKRLGMTPAAQAKGIGVTVTSLDGLTSGKGSPTLATAVRALKWLSSHRL